jgi:hypothetical protein
MNWFIWALLSALFAGTTAILANRRQMTKARKHAFVRICCLVAGIMAVMSAPHAHAQFTGFTNHGLVAVGRLSGESFDALGPNIDTQGGIFSGIAFDPTSWSHSGHASSGFTYHGTLYCVPDRGYGAGALGGTLDYKPRVHTLNVAITPYYGSAATNQTQITLTNTQTALLTYGAGTPFTGFSGNDTTVTTYPKSADDSAGQGHRSLDPEAVVRARGGGFFVGDEYGPFIYRFDSNAVLQLTLTPPEAWIPKVGPAFGLRSNNFTAVTGPDSGRKNNRGIEGIAITPDGKRLFAMLQSPLVQDGGEDNGSRYTRLLVYDIDPSSPAANQAISEFVYELTLNGNPSHTRQTIISEILALNEHQLLVLERDQRGRNSGSTGAIVYKQVVLADLDSATNVLNSSYDLEFGAPSQTSFPLNGLPASIRPVTRQDFVDLLDSTQLSKFGLNLNAALPDTNTMVEKWEGMAVMPLNDPLSPHDYLLLVGCDNDFGASKVYHNGEVVGSNPEVTDNMLLAYRVTLPNYILPALPSLTIQPTGNALQISWPEVFSGFVLQSSISLVPDSWTHFPATGNSVTVGTTNAARFFRLVMP